MADNNSEDCLSMNSSGDFEHIQPDTPTEAEKADLDDKQQKTVKSNDALEANADLTALHQQMAKMQADFQSKLAEQQADFQSKLDAMQSKHDWELDRLRKENVLALATLVGTPPSMLLKGHLKPEFVELSPVNNTENAAWNFADGEFSTCGNSVAKSTDSRRLIRSTLGFPIESIPISTFNPVVIKVNYFEVTIDAMKSQFIAVGLATGDAGIALYTCGRYTTSFGIDNKGTLLYQSETCKHGFAPGGFVQGDTVGCGLMTVPHEAFQKSRWMFFTKKGEIWGTPVVVSLDVPSILYPVVSMYEAGDKVTANFPK